MKAEGDASTLRFYVKKNFFWFRLQLLLPFIAAMLGMADARSFADCRVRAYVFR